MTGFCPLKTKRKNVIFLIQSTSHTFFVKSKQIDFEKKIIECFKQVYCPCASSKMLSSYK